MCSQKRAIGYHKNTQLNTTIMHNDLVVSFIFYTFAAKFNANLMQIYYGLLTKNGGWTTN